MFSSFFVSELKKWVRDPMMAFMIFYPMLFGLLGRYALPTIAENSGFMIDAYADFILAVLALITPFAYGAIVAFSILDDRDDHILTAISVTPLSLNKFLSFRMVMATTLTFFATWFILWFANVGDLSLGIMASLAFLNCLATPMVGFFINAFATNKIEGFAVMKGFGMIIILPVVSLIFTDTKEFIFALAPGFWPAKAISTLVRGEELLNLNYNLYYFIGLAYILVLLVFSYKVFLKRSKV